jgi:FlaA1/EpsC-like NDP-sugar epimerase
MMARWQDFAEKLNGWHRPVVWSLQIAVFALSGVAAFLLRFDFTLPSSYFQYLAVGLPIWLIVKVIVFRLAKLDRSLWKYVSVRDVIRVALSNSVASTVSWALILVFGPSGFPRSVFLLDLIVCFLGTSGLRLAVRFMQEATLDAQSSKVAEKTALIYGAGDAGMTLLREIRNNPKLLYRVAGFIDDQLEKRGLRVAGVPVLGGGEEIAMFVERHKIPAVMPCRQSGVQNRAWLGGND